MCLRALRRFHEKNQVGLLLQDNVPIPYVWIEHIQHFCSSVSCKLFDQPGLIAGRQDVKEGR